MDVRLGGGLYPAPLPPVHKWQLRFTQGADVSSNTQKAFDWPCCWHRPVCGPFDRLAVPPLADEHGYLGNEPILSAQDLGCVCLKPLGRQHSLAIGKRRLRECVPLVRSGQLLSAGN